MNIVKAKISEELWATIPEEHRLKFDYTIKPKEYDYSGDEIWRELRSKSIKAYKAKEEREFKIEKNLL
ncbi:MAG: hypothetical protein JXQ96_23635 [Cyclobacteriaceae bacterium]